MKRFLFLLMGSLLVLVMVTAARPVQAEQRLEIPYVISIPDQGWWTGIAITNRSDEVMTQLVLKFITNSGEEGSTPVFEDYQTLLSPIPRRAILVDTLANLYAGSGNTMHPPELPSPVGSVILSYPGEVPFSVTVFIGSPTGFSYQVFKSSAP
jgi:hypothetical protein